MYKGQTTNCPLPSYWSQTGKLDSHFTEVGQSNTKVAKLLQDLFSSLETNEKKHSSKRCDSRVIFSEIIDNWAGVVWQLCSIWKMSLASILMCGFFQSDWYANNWAERTVSSDKLKGFTECRLTIAWAWCTSWRGLWTSIPTVEW